MPRLPRRMCSVPGCSADAVRGGNGRCAAHAAAFRPVRTVDPVSKRLYNSGRWRRLRFRHLEREPLCRECARVGKVTPASDVDHIKPHKGDFCLFFDENNLQSLCASCHSRKTAAEDGGFGNRVVKKCWDNGERDFRF